MLASRRQGSGSRPLVMLHGFLGAGRNLASLARTLLGRQPDLLIHLPDLPGHGGSAPSARGAGFDAMALEVEAFLDGLGVTGAIDLAGHSFGARVALRCLSRSEAKLGGATPVGAVAMLDMTPGSLKAPAADRMVERLVAAPPLFESRRAAEDYLQEQLTDASLVAWLSMNLQHRPGGELGWRVDRDYLARIHEATREEDLWPVVEAHPGRISVLRGGRSALLSVQDQERLERLGVSLECVEEAGHFLHVDAPEETALFLQRWVSRAL